MVRILICLVTISIGSACNKVFDVACPTDDMDQGLIVQSYLGGQDICVGHSFSSDALNEGVVIRNDTAFESFIPVVDLSNSPCDLVDIDFNTYTLLGIQTQGTGCTISYRRSVREEDARIVFEVTQRECGGCEPLHTASHWVKIPKISADSQVIFSVITQKFNE